MIRINKNIENIKILSKCNKKMRKSIIENGDKDLIFSLCECVLNCINGNEKLNNSIMMASF